MFTSLSMERNLNKFVPLLYNNAYKNPFMMDRLKYYYKKFIHNHHHSQFDLLCLLYQPLVQFLLSQHPHEPPYLLQNVSVILVEPFHICTRHLIDVDHLLLDGDQCSSFEAKVTCGDEELQHCQPDYLLNQKLMHISVSEN